MNLDDLAKLEASSVPALGSLVKSVVEAIVKVKTAHYVPKNVKVRAQIDPYLFTCELPSANLLHLEKDPNVVSFSISKNLHAIE